MSKSDYSNQFQIRIEDLENKHLRRAKQEPSFYAEKFLGYPPYDYQVPPLDDPYRFKAMTMARQIGKTHILALKASHRVNLFEDSRVAIAAQNENRAFEIYRTVKSLQMRHPLFAEFLNPKKDKKSEMELENGSILSFYATGNDGKAIRGDTLHMMILDEADYVPDDVYDAVIPTVSKYQGELLFASTPRKPYSMFHEIFQDGWEARLKYEGQIPLEDDEEPYTEPIGRKFDFASYHYDYKHGIAVNDPITGTPQLDYKLVKMLKNKDYQKFEKEYLAKWPTEGATFLTEKTVLGARRKYTYNIHERQNPYYVMGLDLGRATDYTAIVILQVNANADLGVIVDSRRIRRQNWGIIFKEILRYASKYNVQNIILDANNVGDIMNFWIQSVGQRSMPYNVKPIKMSLQAKTRIYQNMKMALNTNRLYIQENTPSRPRQVNDILLKELKELLVEETTSGMMKIHAPESTGKFDDLADATALACDELRVPNNMSDNSPVDVILHRDDFDDYDDDFVSVISGSDFNTSNKKWDIKPSFSF